MRYYFSLLPDKCDETVQDDVGKCWNLARNFKDGNELVLRKVGMDIKSKPKQTNCHFLL